MSSARRFSQHAQDPEKQEFSGGQSQFAGAYKGSSDFFSGASHTSPVQEEFQGEAMPRGIITRRSTLSSRLRNKPGVSTDKTNTSVSVNSVTSLLDLLPREQEPEKPGLPGGRLQFGSSGLFSRKADSPFSEAGIPLRLRNKPGASTDKTNTSVSVNIVRPAIRLSPRAQVPEKQVFSGGQLQFADIHQGSPDLFSRATNYPSSEAGKLSGTVLRTSTPSQQYISPMMENSRPAKVTKDVHTSPQWTARTQRDKSMVNSRPAAAVGNSMYKQSQWTTRSPRGKRIVTISPTEAMPAPVCLIDNDANGSMRVRREALEILDQITQPVVVVAIVGLYRTGKSFLMNKLAGKHNGFALGATIESETKGIWMWCVPHPTKVGHTLVLLDTEGLGDVEKGDEKHDTWIFCLAVLLSSTLVYNSMGTIDNHALEKLHYVTELTEHIKVKSGTREGDDQSTEFMSYFPSFVWTVRDFTLKLELKGQPVTADQYLDNALKLKTGSSKNIEMYNLPRRCLREFFSPRKCFVFDRPASVEKMWQMEQLTDADLKPSFLKEAEDFRNYIFNNGQAKTMREGLGLTGRMLGTLAETYVKAISSGQVPCLDNAVESLSQIQNKRAVTEALDFYESEMSRNVQLPTETQEDLSEIHTDIQREAVEIFINNSFNDFEQKHQIELMRSLQSVYEEYCRENVETSRKKSKSVISHVFSSLETELQRGSYMQPGGYAEFRYALDKATRLYRSKKGHGLKSEEVLKEYLSEKEKIGFNILAADKSLTEAQQEIERERWESEAREQQQRFLEEQNRIKDQQIMDQQRAYDENISQLLMKMEREQQNAKQEYERLLNARLKEQKDLLEQGFGYRAEQMQREIDSLREKKKSSQSSFVDTAREAAGTALEVAGTAAMMMLPGPAKLLGVGLFAASKFFSSRK